MFDEPHIYRDNYMSAEIVILAHSKDEALELHGILLTNEHIDES